VSLSRPPHPGGRSGFPRLIATDLDGTLFGRDYTISRRSAKVLAQAAGAGTVVVLVTGRPLRWVYLAYDQLAEAYPTICANGAVDYDPVHDAVRASHPLAPPVLAEVCARLTTAVPGMSFAAEIEDGRRMLHEPAYSAGWERVEAGAFEAPLSQIVAQPAVKLLGREVDRDPDELSALVQATVADRVEATHSSNSGLVEMSAPGVTKATGLAALARRLGIEAADVIAFGDMPNDVAMLRWAGRGVAVANAHPAAKAAADEVTLSNEADGVATYLDHLLR
jgi:Cof subfamily protein (haloacid dehalogenase superfamily)